jgi:hypothetical protein
VNYLGHAKAEAMYDGLLDAWFICETGMIELPEIPGLHDEII